jgi:ribonucleoside-diphosphate reductase alpha chain
MEITRVKKRDGRIEKFEKKKIINAIFRAVVAVGGTDRETVELLADKVVEYLKDLNKEMPSVEDVQDAVEKVLIEQGHAKTAKAYILYREKRAELRKEKTRILEKDDIDEVDKKFDVNSLRVLKSRYLEKDDKGKLIETPKQLFTRVAVHAALPSLFYDKRFFVKDCSATKHHDEDFNPETHENKYSIGKYKLNRFHLKGLKKIYDRHNKEGKINVTWSEFFDCLKNKGFDDYEKEIGKFFEIMTSRKFMPNTPAIANFGSHLGMGSACFVLDVKDSMDGIMGTLTATAIIHKAGGGTGFNFSKLRPEGDFISTTKGVSSGPLSFMRLFDTMTEVVKQGGIRRGANMGIMNSNHPDIEKFITSKQGNKALRNFNISVLMMPDFWEHYKNGTSYPLINPRNGSVVRTVDSRRLFDQIVYQAWESGEPGVIFHDRINRHNPFLESLGPIVTTNPCGEVLLYPDEPCNLGSINVWAFAKDNKEGKPYFDWDDLKDSVRTATRLLDNVIDVNQWPLPQIEQMALSTRKVGLGVMGVGDLLYELELPYNTEKARDFMEELMEFINYYSKVESIELARNRGSLPYYEKSFYTKTHGTLTGMKYQGK